MQYLRRGSDDDGQVEQGVIQVAVTLWSEFESEFAENMTKREEVDDEQEGAKDRTSGYTRGEMV